MKIIIKKNVLENIINNTNSYIEKKDSSSITSHILFITNQEFLEIKATDYEIGLSYKIKEVKILSQGMATANGKKILEIIKALKDEEIVLEAISNYLYIKQKNSRYKLPMYNASDFPEFPTKDNKEKMVVNSIMLSRSLKKIYSSIDSNNPNIALNGAFLDIKGDIINVVGTDGKRLSLFNLNQTEKQIHANEINLIIPKKAINEMQKIFYDNVEIFYDKNMLIATCDNFEFYTKLINAKYPKYQNAIPETVKEKVIIKRDKFLEGIKTISMICDKIKVTIKNDMTIFESNNEENLEAKTEILMENNNEQEIGFIINNRYFLDFLSILEDNHFELNYNGPSSAIMLKSDNLTTIIMPIK